jgi:acetyl-CoA C-acetyltransferase
MGRSRARRTSPKSSWAKSSRRARGRPGTASLDWRAGIPVEVAAYGTGSADRPADSGARLPAIRDGDSAVVVAGGQEGISQAAHCIHWRDGVKMGNAQTVDTMIRDGLWEAFNGYQIGGGDTAENVAQRWQITREQQDQFRSPGRTWPRWRRKRRGRFKDEIVAVKDHDAECPALGGDTRAAAFSCVQIRV